MSTKLLIYLSRLHCKYITRDQSRHFRAGSQLNTATRLQRRWTVLVAQFFLSYGTVMLFLSNTFVNFQYFWPPAFHVVNKSHCFNYKHKHLYSRKNSSNNKNIFNTCSMLMLCMLLKKTENIYNISSHLLKQNNNN